MQIERRRSRAVQAREAETFDRVPRKPTSSTTPSARGEGRVRGSPLQFDGICGFERRAEPADGHGVRRAQLLAEGVGLPVVQERGRRASRRREQGPLGELCDSPLRRVSGLPNEFSAIESAIDKKSREDCNLMVRRTRAFGNVRQAPCHCAFSVTCDMEKSGSGTKMER